jgi:hypothetical protein
MKVCIKVKVPYISIGAGRKRAMGKGCVWYYGHGRYCSYGATTGSLYSGYGRGTMALGQGRRYGG